MAGPSVGDRYLRRKDWRSFRVTSLLSNWAAVNLVEESHPTLTSRRRRVTVSLKHLDRLYERVGRGLDVMRSSGQLQYDVTQWRYCGQINHVIDLGHTEAICDFDGEVDVTYDPELRLATWTCPDCAADHEEDLD